MSCSQNCNNDKTTVNHGGCNNSMSYVIVLVLYILLAIIIGSCFFN